MACSIGVAVCRHLIKSKYIQIPDLKEEFLRAKLKPKGTYNLKKRYGRYGLLIVDEWMLNDVGDDIRAFLLEIFELRYKKCSTILCTQAKVEDWHVKLGGDTTVEAIIDRIVRNATNKQIGDVNMRKKIK